MKKPSDYCYYDVGLKDMVQVKKYLEKNDIYWNLTECYVVWEAFSDDYCAQFLCVGEKLLEQFIEWLGKER